MMKTDSVFLMNTESANSFPVPHSQAIGSFRFKSKIYLKKKKKEEGNLILTFA